MPVRPCSVPRDAKVFMAAPALDAAVEPTVTRHKKINNYIYTVYVIKNKKVTTGMTSTCSTHLISLYTVRLASLPQIVTIMRG